MFMPADLGLRQLVEGSGLVNKDDAETTCYIV